MCAVDDCEPWVASKQETRRARKPWRCCECGRIIAVGEQHQFLSGRTSDSDGWVEHRWCQHCDAAAVWMQVVCNGYLIGGLQEELREHWESGYQSLPFARLIAGMRWRWHDGRAAIPTGVAALANEMLAEAVR